MKKYLLLIVLLFYPSYFYASKYFKPGSYAARCLQALENYMHKSNLLSDDLKQACKEHPEEYLILGEIALAIIFVANQRPDYKEIDQAEQKLKKGTATLDDFLIATKTLVTYGEAAHSQGKLITKENEPTIAPTESILPSPPFFEQPFIAALDRAHITIEFLGKREEWTQEKINQEKQSFDDKIVTILQSKKK